MNKADHLTAEELAQSVAFTRQVLAGELGADAAVWPVSARRALAAVQDGSRADLRARLGQTERDLQRELDRRYTDGAGRISRALQAAVSLRARQGPELDAARQAALHRREQTQVLAAELRNCTALPPGPVTTR